MIPINLKLSNFTSYGENPPELDFTRFKLAAISGLNGAGKSSLLDAITWCLWGTSRAGDSSDGLIHAGTDNMQVQFSFELDSHTFTIKRRRSKKGGGSTALEFWSGSPSASSGQGHNLTEGTIKATQEKIINTLHLTFETFTNSSYLRQGHADEFTVMGPTDRKRVLADILGLDHYDKLEEKAKEKIKEAESQLKLLEYQLLEIDAELSQKKESEGKKVEAEKKISEVESKINIVEKELKILGEQKAALNAVSEQQNKLKQTLQSLQTELEDILTTGKVRAEKIKTLERQMEDLPKFDERLTELKNLEKERQWYTITSQKKLELENKLTKTKSELALKIQETKTLETKLVEVKSRQAALGKDNARCPTCGQVINKLQKQKVRQDYSREQEKLTGQIAQIKTTGEESQITKLQKEIDSLKLDDHQYQLTISKINELSSLQEKREKLIAAQATLDSEKKVVGDLRTLFAGKKSQIEKLEIEAGKLPALQEDLEKIHRLTNQKELELESSRLEERKARNLLGQATQLLSRAEQMEKLSRQKLEKKSGLQKQKDIFEQLALAFGKKGIQAMIIEAAIPEIETETNRLLDRLTEGRMKVILETQRETKTKVTNIDGEKAHGIVETLDIIISDEMGERPYEMYSGGEAFRVNFAIRLAISKLLTHRAGAKLQFLVIDEGFGTQDAPGRARLIEVIDAIKDDFEKILIITHLEELKEEFPVRIEVSKNSTGSTFEVVGI